MSFVTECIVNFLKAAQAKHPGPDLLERFLRQGCNMEVQVNVLAGDGEPVAGKKSTFTDGLNEWWNLRIPKDSMGEANFKDYHLTWPLELHAEGIGSTGWDWKNGCSRWVGFDFDALIGHAKGVGITREALEEVKSQASRIPYVETRKSTGGKGLHLYVPIDGIPTANHTEHAALARCILSLMGDEVGYDFAAQIDCCGGNMWVWHVKSNPENEGLKLLKPATKMIGVDDLPPNWRDHIDVVSRKRTKVKVDGIGGDQDPFDALTSARPVVKLDDTHKAIIDELATSGFSTVWIGDYSLCQTHTAALKQMMEDQQVCIDIGLRGVFDTTSSGTDRATPNCFMFPLVNGAWKVYRFGMGVSEHETWDQDGEGWTTCWFNRTPDLKSAAKSLGAAELDKKKGFQFGSTKKAVEAIKMLGEDVTLPPEYEGKGAELKANDDGRLLMKIKVEKDDKKPDSSWADLNGGWIQKVFEVKVTGEDEIIDVDEYDNRLRHLVSPSGEASIGWKARTGGKRWTSYKDATAKQTLLANGCEKADADVVMGLAAIKPWLKGCVPFGEEYPGERIWNFDAPQWAVDKALLGPEDNPVHPHWDRVFQHCFADLTEEIRKNPWFANNGIHDGRDYGIAWLASIFQYPADRLPFLFFYGNQNCGKSIFHEAIRMLMTTGVVDAKKALTTTGDFNGEMAGKVLAVIEEMDITGSQRSYERLKEWVTGEVLSIREMRTTTYEVVNFLHFCMMANSMESCPVFDGDTRINVIEVSDLAEDIPKETLKSALRSEASHFRWTLENTKLPPLVGRLRLPMVETGSKRAAVDEGNSELVLFLEGCCYHAPGEKIPLAEFYRKFRDTLDPSTAKSWGKTRLTDALPKRYPYGIGTGNVRYVTNITFIEEVAKASREKTPYVAVGKRVKLQGEKE